MDSSSASAVPPSHRVFSCDRCTRRKQRCDRRLPRCAACRLAGAACNSTEREATVVQGSDKGAVTRKGAVTLLLERVAALEEETTRRLHECRRPASSRDGSDDPRPDAEPDPEPRGEHAAEDAATTTTGHAADDDAAEPTLSINPLSLAAMAEPRNRADEFLQHLSTPRLVAGVTETFGGNPESTARVGALWEGISQYIRQPAGASHRLYIPRHEAVKALDTYLDIVDFRYPRLPVAKVQAGIDAISSTGSSGEKAYARALAQNPSHIFLAYLVVAIVPLVSDSYPISQGSWVSAHLLSKCLKLLDRVFALEDGVDIIQCLHLLVILAMHCSTAGSAWHLAGLAMNKCIALGYHREGSRAAVSLSSFDIQQRRWAFWGCYLLERLICASLGRPCSIDHRDISVPLPHPGSPAGNASVLGGGLGALPASLAMRELAHVHFFRYAMLLSSAVQEPPGSADPTSHADFENLLGQALYWRAMAPTKEDARIADVQAHQTSFYNTLLLRIIIREIDRGFAFVYPSRDGEQPQAAYHETPQVQYQLLCERDVSEAGLEPPFQTKSWIVAREKKRMDRIRLLPTCGAVARSLDRTRMVGRAYLSILTGYMSLSMGLACLYYLAVTSSPAGRHLDTATFATTTGRGSWGSQLDYLDPQTILSLACQKLETAGRQFPRLEEYRVILERVRHLVSAWPTRFQVATHDGLLIETEIEELKTVVCTIRPPYLRLLAAATIYMLELT